MIEGGALTALDQNDSACSMKNSVVPEHKCGDLGGKSAFKKFSLDDISP